MGEVRDRFGNREMAGDVLISESDRAYLVEFLRALATSKSAFLHHSLRYHHLADMIEHGRARSLACHYFMGGAILGSDGTLYYCKHSKAIGSCLERPADEIYFSEENLDYRARVLRNTICRTCPPNTYNKMEIEKDLFKVARYLVGAKGSR
jgi:hypothetical protein